MNRSFLLVGAIAPVVAFVAGSVACNDPPQQQQPPQVATQYPPQPYPPQPYPQPYPQQQPYPQPYPQPQPQPQPPMPQPQPTYTAPPQQPQPQPQPTTPPPQPTSPQPAPPQPGPFPVPPAPSGQTSGTTATAIDPAFAQVATAPLFIFAATEAPGMQREGNIVAGQFQQRQQLETPITLQPNKCYTVLAVGAGLLSEVDINLVLTTPVQGLHPLLARDSGGGVQASLGGKGNCYPWKLPFPAQAKFVIIATKGTGIAAGALYVK